jgi:hypothetical protein
LIFFKAKEAVWPLRTSETGILEELGQPYDQFLVRDALTTENQL